MNKDNEKSINMTAYSSDACIADDNTRYRDNGRCRLSAALAAATAARGSRKDGGRGSAILIRNCVGEATENAGVENAGAYRRGGKCRSRLAEWNAEPILYIDRPLS